MAGASLEDGLENAAALVAIAAGGGAVEETPSAEGSAAAPAVTDGKQEGLPAVALEETEEDEDDRLVGQYSSTQSILLVGEGDFSFALALATGFGSGENLVATSLDRYDTLKKMYSRAESNLAKLKEMGAVILHGVDAKRMRLHTDLSMRKFDRVVFNFPHAGFRGKEDDGRLIELHQELMTAFFRSASLLLRPDGEVHVSHKTKHPYNKWDLPGLAADYALVLVDQPDFRITDYPGYNNKRGDGASCDQPFMLGHCSTFKFRMGCRKMRAPARRFGSVPLPSIGNDGVHSSSSGTFVSHAPQRQWHQPCGPFEMFGMPLGSGFTQYDYATQRLENGNVHQSSSVVSSGHSPPVAPEWPQPYDSFDMFGKPRSSGFLKYDYAARSCLPGFDPQQNSDIAGSIPRDDQRYQRQRLLIAQYGRQ